MSSWAAFFNESLRDYNNQTGNNFELNQKALYSQYATALKPYPHTAMHAMSVVYPFSNLIHSLRSVAQILKGIMLLGYTLVNHSQIAPLMLIGIGQEIGSLILNTLSIASSIVSLFTRTAATILNYGYKNSVQAVPNQIDDSKLCPEDIIKAKAKAFQASTQVLIDSNIEKECCTLNLFRMAAP